MSREKDLVMESPVVEECLAQCPVAGLGLRSDFAT